MAEKDGLKRPREEDNSVGETKTEAPLSFEQRKKLYGNVPSSSSGARSKRPKVPSFGGEKMVSRKGQDRSGKEEHAHGGRIDDDSGTDKSPRTSKYGPGEDEEKQEGETQAHEDMRVANFGLSGALQKDVSHGNMKYGVLLKYNEPADALTPTPDDDVIWRLYVFKGTSKEPIEIFKLDMQSAYLVGKDEIVCDVLALHSSISKQHCVIQFRRQRNYPSLMDLKSTNGTRLNGKLIEDSRFYELRPNDVINLGESTRDYVLVREEMRK